ncbi:MAG: cyclic nucleotide-binding domain-containing protein [Nitrospinae bacterium]|nr:cyclic nucleotide-binding domain-containing protein [Nitrospinota bacterium]
MVAYELLSGVRPFTATDRFALYEKILRVEPRPLREINPGIPERIAAIISICLNKDPSLRLPSCAAFAAQLDEVINESYFTGAGEAVTQETLNIIRQYRENFPFFFDLDNAQVYRLLQVCKARDFKQGEVIFEEGTVAREMFLLISGKVRISRRHAASDSLVILTLKRGEVFGEMGIIDGGPRSAAATAETDCRALALHQVSLLRCDDNTAGKLYRNLAHILSAKLRVTSARLEDFSRRPNIS